MEDAGWQVINRDEYAPGMTAVAVLEAKREEIALDNPHLIAQAENYTKQVPSLSKYFLIANQEGTEKINGHPISARKEKSNPRENPFQGDYG